VALMASQSIIEITENSKPTIMLAKCITKAAARSFSSTACVRKEIKKVGVVGMGSMGHGIVQLSAQNGYQVVAVDLDQNVIDHAM